MSRKRRDPRTARLRRDRIRREKHVQRMVEAPDPALHEAYAMERMLRRFEVLAEQHTNPEEPITAGPEELAAVDAAKEDDPRWRAQELAYDAMESEDVGEAVDLVEKALDLDPDCIDAEGFLVSIAPTSPENRIELMRQVVDKAEGNMGEEFFQENAGHFWQMVSTRPYMRAKQALGLMLEEAGQSAEAASIFERMLDLNPDDNQGIRSRLLALYLAAGELERARGVLARYPDKDSWFATFGWGRVIERWLAGELSEAAAALGTARGMNAFVEAYMLGAKRIPLEAPRSFRPGEDSEAQVCASDLAGVLKAHPGFREWLRSPHE